MVHGHSSREAAALCPECMGGWTPPPEPRCPLMGDLKIAVPRDRGPEFVLVKTIPHDCTDPTCEGARNKRKLEAFGDLVEALRNIENDDRSIPEPIWAMRNAALARAEATEKGGVS